MSDNTSTQKTDWQSRELGALWKRTSRTSGQRYLAGHVKEVDEHGVETRKKVVIFANKNKQEGEKTPDYRIYESRDREDVAKPTQEEGEEDLKVVPAETGEDLEETL